MRKPNSQVNGDITPRLVTINDDLLALPLTHIYNEELKTYHPKKTLLLQVSLSATIYHVLHYF